MKPIQIRAFVIRSKAVENMLFARSSQTIIALHQVVGCIIILGISAQTKAGIQRRLRLKRKQKPRKQKQRKHKPRRQNNKQKKQKPRKRTRRKRRRKIKKIKKKLKPRK